MDAPELHRRAVESFNRRVHAITAEGWERETPNPGWSVRTLVNHLVSENLWTAPLLDGATVEEIGDRFDGDLLGDEPVQAWDESAAQATAAVGQKGAMERIVHLSFGDLVASEYTMQLFADHLIHGWDLARAIGADEKLDPELVDACKEWFTQVEELYRGGGATGPRPEIPRDADPQTELLAMFGRRA